MSKPFKGIISNWKKVPIDLIKLKEDYPNEKDYGLGYYITGVPHGHPNFKNWIYTSWVVKHNETTGEVETRNSIYRLEGPGSANDD